MSTLGRKFGMRRPRGGRGTAAAARAAILSWALPAVIAGCGPAALCPRGNEVGVTSACMREALRHGDEVWLYTHTAVYHNARFIGIDGSNGPAVFLVPDNRDPFGSPKDTLRVDPADVRQISRPTRAAPFVGGVFVGTIVTMAAFLWFLTSVAFP